MARHRLDGTVKDPPWWWDWPTNELPIVQPRPGATRVRPYVLASFAPVADRQPRWDRAGWWKP
jgi:hypothetical protein